MKRSFVLVWFVMTAATSGLVPAPARAQAGSPMAGIWTLNRSLSEFPSQIGFNANWWPASTDGQSTSSSGGGRGRRGSAGPSSVRSESYEDARRVQLLTAEVRTPPVRLMVVDTPAAVTITNELGQSRTLHPDGKEESIEIQGVLIAVTTRRDGDRLVVAYRAERDRELRYTFSHSASPSQLVVEVQFLEHGAGDKVRRVYEPGVETVETAARSAAGSGTASPASSPKPPDALDQRPGAELRGLKAVGIVVEDLGAQATACGLSRDAIESALTKRLTDGGFTVRRNSDEDTYVYINVMTSRLGDGTCVSRYDTFLYTHATATLSYRETPVLVQVSLMHRGGISGGALSTHTASVVRGLQNDVDVFVTQIHDANK